MQVKTGGVSIFYQSIYYISFECLFLIVILSLRIDNIVKKSYVSLNYIHFCSSYIFFILQYELLKDHKALNTVRELLVIIRIWGLLRPSCLPVFLRSTDNLDVLALLFCLLSKLVQPNGDPQQQQQIDDGLIGMFTNFLEFYIIISEQQDICLL